MHITCGEHPYHSFWTKSGHFWSTGDPFQGPKGQIWDYLGPQNGLICSINGRLGALRGAPNLQKWTSDDFPVNICQLDYYVVFGAQSGLLQDLERGK